MVEVGTHSEQNKKLDLYVCLVLAGEGDEIQPWACSISPLQLIYINAYTYICAAGTAHGSAESVKTVQVCTPCEEADTGGTP